MAPALQHQQRCWCYDTGNAILALACNSIGNKYGCQTKLNLHFNCDAHVSSDACSVSCLIEENIVLCMYVHFLLLYASVRIWECTCAQAYIYTGGAPCWTIYKMLICFSNNALLDELFYVCMLLIL